MSVKIRLRRMGKKKQPHYRIVVTDTRAPRDGRFVENIGYYNPMSNPGKLSLDLGRVDYWVGEGAIVSPTVGSLVSKARAGGDDIVAMVGASSDGDAGAEVVSANGDAAVAASEGEESPAPAPEVAAGDADAEDAEDEAPAAAEAAGDADAEDSEPAEAPAAAEAAGDADAEDSEPAEAPAAAEAASDDDAEDNEPAEALAAAEAASDDEPEAASDSGAARV